MTHHHSPPPKTYFSVAPGGWRGLCRRCCCRGHARAGPTLSRACATRTRRSKTQHCREAGACIWWWRRRRRPRAERRVLRFSCREKEAFSCDRVATSCGELFLCAWNEEASLNSLGSPRRGCVSPSVCISASSYHFRTDIILKRYQVGNLKITYT